MLVVGLLVGAAYSAEWTGVPGKTLWDWLELLIVPVVLAGGGIWFNRSQQERDQSIAEQRRQDEVLQVYLDQIGPLIGHEANNSPLARARTVATMQRLDSEHVRLILSFLREADAIATTRTGPYEALVTFTGADLTGINFHGADLRDLHFVQTNLRGINLRNADLTGAVFLDADLTGADLTGADLTGANLEYAIGITAEELDQQAYSLERADMPGGQKYEDWLRDK